jgi:outer membrane protein TolC
VRYRGPQSRPPEEIVTPNPTISAERNDVPTNQEQVEELPPLRTSDRNSNSGQGSSIPVNEMQVILANAVVKSENPKRYDVAHYDLSQEQNVRSVESTRLSPIAPSAWDLIPERCRRRMYEFESIRLEYSRSFSRDPAQDELVPGDRLALEDLVETALINSRDYQSTKEALYLAALDLTLQRFAFETQFSTIGNRLSPFGNGTAVDFAPRTFNSTYTSTLRTPTSAELTKVVATGGNLLARFANDIVLTFNGPSGFAADISSDLFLSFSQSVFQRDVLFEPLTQSERNVIYAARTLARFRKTLFFNVASAYYGLLLNYRQIEIDSHNYFTLVRAYGQRSTETRVGLSARVQLDQVEQNTITARSSLVTDCNNLEKALDTLKLQLGLAPETPLNLDLQELQWLTLRDRGALSDELVRRSRNRLIELQEIDEVDETQLINRALQSIDRLFVSIDIRGQLGQDTSVRRELELLRLPLLVREANALAERQRSLLAADRATQPAVAISRIAERVINVLDALRFTIEREYEAAQQLNLTTAFDADLTYETVTDINRALETARIDMDRIMESLQLQQMPQLVAKLDQLHDKAEQVAEHLEVLLKSHPLFHDSAQMQRHIARLLQLGELILQSGERNGLAPIEVELDDLLLTAIINRLDLANQREAVADNWRQIKYAGDALKSVLNITVTQRLRAEQLKSNPANTDLSDAPTHVIATLDTPINRKSQRNSFRASLINYNVALRSLSRASDNIKFNIRDDLRDIRLDQEQYKISVASAALASERVDGTSLQLRLGVAGVAARDFLEAQNALNQSLSAVAARHLNYIVDRAALFLDSELMAVNENGFWDELYDENYKPTPHFELIQYPAYGMLPSRVLQSRMLKRMLGVPAGIPIHPQPAEQPSESISPDTPITESHEAN